MENQFDALAKSLAGSVSRREALARLGGGVAGLLLAAVGLGKAWGDRAPNSHCEDFCRGIMRDRSRRRQCVWQVCE